MKRTVTSKRFVREYASYKIENMEQNEFISREIVESTRHNVEKIMRLYNNGFITHDEAIRMLWEV